MGIFLSVLVFLDVFFSGTWGYGVILIVTGLIFLAYDYVIYEQGNFLLGILPSISTQSSIYSVLQNNLNWIVVLLILPTIVSIGEGIYILGRR